MKRPLEVRFTESPGLQAESSTSGKKGNAPVLKGYAAVFNSMSENLNGFHEVIAPGAFSSSIRQKDIRALYSHDSAAILGRTRNGTLKLWEDRHGLGFELHLPPTQLGKDVAALVERRDVSKMSFGFVIAQGGDQWSREGGLTIRRLTQIDLFEVSLVGEPAYKNTSVYLRRALDAVVAAMLTDRRRRLEALHCE